MPSREQMLAEIEAAEAQGWRYEPKPAPVPSREQMLAEIEAAEAQGWTPQPRSTLKLKRPYMPGSSTMGAPDPSDTRTMGEKLRGAAASISEPWVESAKGIHDLMGGSPEELSKYDAVIGELRRQSPQGAGRTAGNVVGEALQFAIPGGVGAKAGTAALRAAAARLAAKRGMVPAAAAAGEATGIGAYEGLTTPGSAEERTQAGLTGGAGSLAGAGAGQLATKAFQKLARPVKVGDPARELLDQGYKMTPKQAAPEGIAGRIEGTLEKLPIWQGRIESMRGVPLQQFQDDVWTSISPATKGVTGNRAAQAAQKDLGRQYDEVFGNMASTPIQDVRALTQSLTRKGGSIENTLLQFDDATRQTLGRFMNAKLQNLSRRPTANAWQGTLTGFKDKIGGYRSKGMTDEAEVLENVRDSLSQLLPKETRSSLADLNRRYRDLSVVQKAMRYQPSAEAAGEFSPIELLKASRKMSGDRQFAAGTGTFQDKSLKALNLSPGVAERRQMIGGPGIKDAIPAVAAGAAGYMAGGPVGAAAIFGAGQPLAREWVRKPMMGQTGMQQWLAREDIQKTLAQLLRSGGSRVGAGVASQREKE